MKRTASILLRWLLFISYASLVLYLSTKSSIPGHSRVPDKLGHAIEYMLLGFLSARAIQKPGTPHRPRDLLFSWAFCAIFGVFDELVQSGTPGRECSIGDWAADFAGISLSHLLILRRSYKERSSATNEMS
jgi:VanZ family protein